MSEAAPRPPATLAGPRARRREPPIWAIRVDGRPLRGLTTWVERRLGGPPFAPEVA